MSGAGWTFLALLAALPATWCVRQMVIRIPSWLDLAEEHTTPSLDAGSPCLSQRIEPAHLNASSNRFGISITWNLLVFLALAALFVCSAVAWGTTLQAVSAMALACLLLALAAIDLRTGLLPDVLTKPGLALGLAINIGSVWTTWDAAMIGAMVGYWLLWLFFQLYRLATHKEGMGYGDFKLFAMLGAWLGWASLAPILLLASLAAMLVAVIGLALKKWTLQSSLPFGPFLAFGGILRLFEWI